MTTRHICYHHDSMRDRHSETSSIPAANTRFTNSPSRHASHSKRQERPEAHNNESEKLLPWSVPVEHTTRNLSIHNRSQTLPANLVWANETYLTETDKYPCLSISGFEKQKLPRRYSSTSAQTAHDILWRLRGLLMYVTTKITPMLPKEAEIVEKEAPTPVLMH